MSNNRYLTFSTFRLVLAAMVMIVVASELQADESLPTPRGKVILEITGAIAKTNSEQKAQFDHEMLEAIGFSKLSTSTPWTEGVPVFSGVEMSKLLDYVGAAGDTVLAVALNDYKVEIPISQFRDYPIVLASTMDGKRMSVRDKGPLWIIYPRDHYEELMGKEYHGYWIWQLKALQVK